MALLQVRGTELDNAKMQKPIHVSKYRVVQEITRVLFFFSKSFYDDEEVNECYNTRQHLKVFNLSFYLIRFCKQLRS